MNTYLPPQKVIDGMKDIKPKGIILHHTAGNSNSTPADITHWFVVGRASEGYVWCGYHALIYKDGTVVQTRPWTKKGGHIKPVEKDGKVISMNDTHIGISFVGNYDLEPPTDVMWTAYKDLVTSLKVQYPEIQDITNHRDAYARIGGKYTLCPGKYLYELSEIKTEPPNSVSPTPEPLKTLQDYTTIELLTELTIRYADK